MTTDVLTGAPFRGWVRYDTVLEMVDLTLLPIAPTDVVVRNLAAQACWQQGANQSEAAL